MPLNPGGYLFVDSVPIPQAVRDSFVDLPPDPYCPRRFRRFSQFQMHPEAPGCWSLTLLPHRALIQPRRNNAYVGGVARFLEPMVMDVSALVSFVADGLGLDRATTWQLDAHQWRTFLGEADSATSVPEGIHCDGHAFAAVLVVERHNVRGGLTSLYYPGEPPTRIFEIMLGDRQGILLDDSRLLHFTSEVRRRHPGAAYRDIFVFDFNRWDQRRYGADFETFAARG